MIRHKQRILGHDAGWNANELGIGAIVEEQIVAEIFLAARAEIALAAGRGVERHNAVAGRKIRDALAGFDHRSRQLVPKERWRHNHARMIAAAEDLQVGSAGERRTHADNQLAGPGLGNRNLLDANILAAVEDRGLHGAAAVEKRVLDGPAAQADGGFDRPAALDDHVSTVFRPDFDHRLDGIQASLDDVLDFLAALFDNSLDGLAAPEDRGFYRVRHRISSYSAPPPGTGSIIIFMESAWGLEAISMASTASSSGKRCEISCVRSNPLR